MIVGVDFDGCVVDDSHPYSDTETPLRFIPGAREGLASLKRAGHVLLLYSARANRALREDPNLDPLVRAGIRHVSRDAWLRARPIHEARFIQMLEFVYTEIPDVFDAIDDGLQGKPCVDLFIDDRAFRYGKGTLAAGWRTIAQLYGEPVYGEPQPARTPSGVEAPSA